MIYCRDSGRSRHTIYPAPNFCFHEGMSGCSRYGQAAEFRHSGMVSVLVMAGWAASTPAHPAYPPLGYRRLTTESKMGSGPVASR
jgi:hypothetical protein